MKTLHLAQYIVNECQQYGQITPLKLQKLLYYIKAWGEVAGKKLLKAPFKKWDYGPVNPEVYHAYKEYGRKPIPFMKVPKNPTGKEKKLIDFISTCYAQFNAVTLSAMTHEEKPWQETPKDKVISVRLMKEFYRKQPFAGNFPFDPDRGPFYPVDSDSSHAFTMDMSEEEAEQVKTYSSYRSYLEHIQKASGEYKEWRNHLLA